MLPEEVTSPEESPSSPPLRKDEGSGEAAASKDGDAGRSCEGGEECAGRDRHDGHPAGATRRETRKPDEALPAFPSEYEAGQGEEGMAGMALPVRRV